MILSSSLTLPPSV
ncbi:hypothetical protein LINPERHAP2_LOCUS37310 [Linum perenne]